MEFQSVLESEVSTGPVTTGRYNIAMQHSPLFADRRGELGKP